MERILAQQRPRIGSIGKTITQVTNLSGNLLKRNKGRANNMPFIFLPANFVRSKPTSDARTAPVQITSPILGGERYENIKGQTRIRS